ncbi:hypothetical protein MUN88_09500 [Gracilibacillus caseinilyticus]|uniref:Uncharacterized protein n=1 Tax=Gracilibacillus caseinilyticus TaxID=2932256 RepID=A0ABY4F316_9BACI|nr:hypothetical protein [Gracilibacillus caseinilyticus]UOQ50264.1 hypothetical protein MUN88_09500 [Gracilibacillus caseinilyticus]
MLDWFPSGKASVIYRNWTSSVWTGCWGGLFKVHGGCSDEPDYFDGFATSNGCLWLIAVVDKFPFSGFWMRG